MIPVTAKHIDGDTWEVSLPRRKSAVKHKDGIRPRRRVHANSEQEAKDAGAELFADEILAYKTGVTKSLADLAVYYIDHAESDGVYTAETAGDYRRIVLRYVEPNFALDVDQVTAIDIERLYAFLLAEGGRKGDGISPSTVHKLNSALRAAYAFFVREGVVAVNPMPAVELPARIQPAKRSLTESEFVKVLDGLEAALEETPSDREGVKRRNMLFGAYLDIFIGARVGEICALARGDVHAVERSVRIGHSMSEKGGLHRKTPKTAAGRRSVTLDDEPWAMLERHYAWQASYLTDDQRASDLTPVCCTAGGGWIAPSDMSAAFKEFCASVGVELSYGESFHALRHTHATQLLANKTNPKAVQLRLGHSRIETTFGYAHVMPGDDAATAADYGEIVDRTRRAGGFR